MNISFRNAVVASTVIHSFIFVPFLGLNMPIQEKEVKKDMVVDYVVVKEPAKVNIAAKQLTIKTVETPKVELNRNVQVKPAEAPKPVESKKEAVTKTRTDERIAKKEAQIKSTKDYVGYYQFIREKIRQRLKANYKNYHKEGDVRLIFTLDCYGGLRDINVDDAASTSDGMLRDMAVMSLREASPFPAFPKALSLARMSFDVVVSFRRE